MSQHKDIALAVFVKTPGLSPVKTRLAASIGRESAEEVYQLCLQKTEEALIKVSKKNTAVQVFWAVAEKEAVDQPIWRKYPTVVQMNGSLGDRIHSVYDELKRRYKTVLIMGGDSPTLDHEAILNAMAAAERHPYVIGRTEDGGFYLFASQRTIPASVWKKTEYSTSSTAQSLCNELEKEAKVYELPILFDIDTGSDLNRAAQEIPELKPFVIH